MNAALIYRPLGRWLVWVAFGCAVAIHLTAIVLAENKARVASPSFPSGDEVIAIDNPSPSTPPEEEAVTPPDQIPPVTDNDAFPEENVTKPPIRPRKKTPVMSVVRSIGTGTTTAPHVGSAKALTLYAPRPNYPYEARRGGITGSGTAQLTVNSEAGNVIEARMSQSTGSVILDNATLETLRRWRFKPGVASNVEVPITYTLTGVSY
jgi:periplasmic protein TonB